MQGSFEEMDGPCILVIGAVVLFAERVGDEPALEGPQCLAPESVQGAAK
jgi:hypothetical protein